VIDYLPILAMFILAGIFAGVSFFASRMLAPQRPTPAKEAPYECGIVPEREPAERFPVRFYLVAMIFIIFDIEIIFLFPWATVYKSLGTYGLLVLAEFTVPFIIVFVWMVSHGALDWGPVRRGRREVPADDARLGTRTITSTVRRVGMDGRFPLDASLPKEEVA
jgi:NADH-quinone oxidoreductase subunit A